MTVKESRFYRQKQSQHAKAALQSVFDDSIQTKKSILRCSCLATNRVSMYLQLAGQHRIDETLHLTYRSQNDMSPRLVAVT